MTIQEKLEAMKILIDLLKSDTLVTNGHLRELIVAKLFKLVESL